MDRKICIFTQTYNDNRFELFDYLPNDNLSIEFRNAFDLNIYSFHNSDREYINKVKGHEYFKKLKNVEFNEFYNITYPQTFKKILYQLLDWGYTYVGYSQDDVFTCGIHYNITDLVDFIKTQDFKMLYLEATGEELGNETIYYEKNDLKIYNTTTEDFFRRDGWAMDDGAYVGNIQYMLDNIFDENYFGLKSIHDGEGYLNRKFKTQKIERLTTNLKFYKRYNIIGPNSHWNGENDRKMLKHLFT